jgi:hypothetical protein
VWRRDDHEVLAFGRVGSGQQRLAKAVDVIPGEG